MLSEKSVLVTGGTGSFGKAFAKTVLHQFPSIKRLVIFSRDELKQFEMSCEPEFQSNKVRFFIGDIRDPDRIRRALEGVDVVVHAAALKQVTAAEYNPFEAIKTNVIGAQNLIEACLDSKIEKVVALSTDKAAAPINLYGATKLCADKLFTAANGIVGSRKLRFSVVRYGNVMCSRGSVIPLFMKLKESGTLPVTDVRMTRFNISLSEGVESVLWALKYGRGGEIFVPKLRSYRILDIAKAVCENCTIQEIGIRPGEKLHEEMITTNDSHNCVDLGDYFAILNGHENVLERYCKDTGAKAFPAGTSYSSELTEFLSVEELKQLIDQNFHPNSNA